MTQNKWETDPVRRGKRAVGSRTGLLSDISFSSASRDEENTVTAAGDPGSLATMLPLDVQQDPSLGLGGKGETTAEAATTLLGEFFERYCLFHPLGDAFNRTTAPSTELASPHVPIEYLDVVDQQRSVEIGFEYFDEKTTVDWVQGITPTGERKYVPAELVSVSHQVERTLGDHSPHFYANSNGCACGSKPSGAVLRALYEAIERDAIMRTWYNQTTPERIDIADIPAVKQTYESVSSDKITHTLVDLGGVNGIHVVGVVITQNESELPNFVVSASASIDFVTAACDALSESMQVYRHMREIAVTKGFVDEIDLTSQANLWACPQYYAQPQNYEHVQFLTDGPLRSPETPLSEFDCDNRKELETVLSKLAQDGVTPILFDLTTPDVRTLGMHVTKAITPELIDMPLPALPPVDHPDFHGEIATKRGHPIA